jgi:hypothetical protein
VEGETDYEKAISQIGTAGEAGSGSLPIAIDLEAVLRRKIGVRRIGFAEVGAVLESVEKQREAAAGEAASKQMVGKRVELGKKIVGIGVYEAEKELVAAEAALDKEFGGKIRGNAVAAEAARELNRAVKSVEKEFGEAIKKESRPVRTTGLVLPRLSLQDQLSELELISEGLDKGTFNGRQKKTIISEIIGIEAVAARENAGGSVENADARALRDRKIRDIKGKLNIK